MDVPAPAIDDLFGDADAGRALGQRLEQSLNPRSPDMLVDLLADCGLGADSLVLDVGCWAAVWACRLADAFGCTAIGVDVARAAEAAAARHIAAQKLDDRVTFLRADIRALPLASSSCDLVWCRDMLGQVANLATAIAECARVLKPRGHMLVFGTFEGALLEPREADRLYRALAIVPENMSARHLEHLFAESELQVLRREVVSSEWREHDIENGNQQALRDLLTVARLLRNETELVAEFGRMRYEMALANAMWWPFQLIGKLTPQAYLLRKVG